MIDLFEALDKSGIKIELKIVQCGFQSVQFFFDILKSSTLKVLGLDLEDGDLVNEFTQRDGGKDVLDWLWLDCRPSRSVLRGS